MRVSEHVRQKVGRRRRLRVKVGRLSVEWIREKEIPKSLSPPSPVIKNERPLATIRTGAAMSEKRKLRKELPSYMLVYNSI